MKRIAFLLAALLLLCGCGRDRGIYSNYRAIEDLQPVQTLGIDANGTGLVLSAAAGRPQSGGSPTLLRRGAVSIPEGMAALQLHTPKGQLYFAHTQFLVLGQAYAAGGVDALLDFVERDVHTRMGTALFVVRGGTAETLITGAGEDWDVSDSLSTVSVETAQRGDSHVFNVRETAVALSEYGAALICTLRTVDTGDSVFSLPTGLAAVPDGYGILKHGALIGFLDGDSARAASLLLGVLGTVTREFSDGCGGTVTAELSCGRPDIRLVRGPDSAYLEIRAAPTAVIAALDPSQETAADTAAPDALAAAVNAALVSEIVQVLDWSRAEQADFLALGRALRLQGVDPARLPADWLETLDVRVTVETTVRHSYDMGAPAGTDGGSAA